MSLFRTIGRKVKGLLGDEQLFDRLARAQAFAHGDHLGAHKIGAALRVGAAAVSGPGEDGGPSAGGEPLEFGPHEQSHAARPTWRRLPPGYQLHGYTYRGGDPNDRFSWERRA